MSRRYLNERDFALKTSLRKLLWMQGFSTRVNTLLGFPFDSPSGRPQRSGVTDLDVFGVRLDPGFRLTTLVSECKSGRESAAETLFWLKGVAALFEADELVLVRSETVPSHAKLLAQSLGISVLTLADIGDLSSAYSLYPESEDWERFFSPEIVSSLLDQITRLPIELREVGLYRETYYWMQSARYSLLTRTVASLRPLGSQRQTGRIAEMVFADYVWLMVLAIWEALEKVTAFGVANIEESLRTYLVGGPDGLRSAQRMQAFVRELGANSFSGEVAAPIYPPYFDKLLELIVRCVRRPTPTSMLAQRAEWLLYGQMVGELGPLPGATSSNSVLCDKLLGDIAIFLAEASDVDDIVLTGYLSFIES